MELNQLRCALALAEEANFSRAAARLGIAQPSLSQQIKRLESAVGRPLFDRLPRKVLPTPAGQKLVEHARQILQRVADAEREMAEGDGDGRGLVGTVAVGAIPTVAPFLLPAVIGELARRHPDLQVHVVEDVTARLVERIENGELEVAILSDHPGSRTVHVEPLATDPLLLLVAKSHPLARRKSVSLTELTEDRFLVLHEMHCLAGQVDRICQRRRVNPPVVMRGAQLGTIGAMVAAGAGVSVVPGHMRASGSRAADGCAFVPFADKPAPSRSISAAWSLLRYRTNAARAVTEVLQRHVVKLAKHGG